MFFYKVTVDVCMVLHTMTCMIAALLYVIVDAGTFAEANSRASTCPLSVVRCNLHSHMRWAATVAKCPHYVCRPHLVLSPRCAQVMVGSAELAGFSAHVLPDRPSENACHLVRFATCCHVMPPLSGHVHLWGASVSCCHQHGWGCHDHPQLVGRRQQTSIAWRRLVCWCSHIWFGCAMDDTCALTD